MTEHILWSVNAIYMTIPKGFTFLGDCERELPINLRSSIAALYGDCNAAERKTLQSVIRMCERVISISLVSLETIFKGRKSSLL